MRGDPGVSSQSLLHPRLLSVQPFGLEKPSQKGTPLQTVCLARNEALT